MYKSPTGFANPSLIFTQTALQFPDELLRHSVPIYRSLMSRLGPGRELYVLADTSYGRHAKLSCLSQPISYSPCSSCCVDEVAAKHADVDAVVHYGHACMSQCVHWLARNSMLLIHNHRTYRLPVIYVFGKKEIDVDDCVAQFVAQCRVEDLKKPVILRHDVGYSHQICV